MDERFKISYEVHEMTNIMGSEQLAFEKVGLYGYINDQWEDTFSSFNTKEEALDALYKFKKGSWGQYTIVEIIQIK